MRFSRLHCGPRPRRRAVTGVLLGLGACVAQFAACGGRSGPLRAPRESLLDDGGARPAFTSPAVWRYHPRNEAALLARQELSDGTILYAGERGERWLYHKKRGSVRAAARLAPEPLIAVLHLSDGGWLFVGQSGTGYEAREPLGPFVRTSAPVDKLARVAAAGTSVVGVTRDGQLVHSSDAGASWKAVGDREHRMVDVMLSDPKRGLALSVPEVLWETRDGGATWKKLPGDTVGALGLGWDDKAGVAVRTALGWMRWDPSAPKPLSELGRAPAKSRFRLIARPERGPDARALAEGRALVLDGRYLELATDSTSSSSSSWRSPSSQRWSLWQGPIDGKLETKKFPAADGCQSLKLAAFGRYMYLACSRSSSSGSNQEITIKRSVDGGKSFETEPYSAEGRWAEIGIAVGPEGALLMTGICPPHNRSRGCVPYGVYHRRRAQTDGGTEGGKSKRPADGGAADGGATKTDEQWELSPSATPALKAGAMALAFSPDGRTAFAVGRRTKGNALVVFVSRDRGESFDAHEIEQAEAVGPADPPPTGYWAAPPPSPVATLSSVRAAEDGTLAIVLGRSGAPSLVVVDEEGRIVSLSRAPGEATSLGAYGTRALAFSETTRNAWESLDGGASWDAIGKLPAGTCRSDGTGCNSAVSCHAAGCIIGTELSRIGWHGQADDEQGVLGTPDTTAGDIYDRKVRTPIGCTLDEKGWQPLAGASSPPSANLAAIGKVAWYMLVTDDQKASATHYYAHGGNRAHIESVPLLSPVTKPSEYAYRASVQAEGSAALRYPAGGAGGTTLKNVEVVWDNLLEGKLVRQRVAELGPVQVGDYSRSGPGAQAAHPHLMSIASGGIYVRVHASARDDQNTVFLDGKSVASVPPVRWPSATLGTRTEMVHAPGGHVPVMFVGSGAAVVRARRDGAAWAFSAVATGLAEPSRFGLTQSRDLSYVKNRSGLSVLTWDPDGLYSENWLFPFRADGPVVDAPVALPTQQHAGEKPTRCGSVHRADTPRTVVPYQAGTRHPVIVTDAVEPMRVLLTGHAVMHGSPKDACVAAFDAEVVAIDPSLGAPEQERAILPLDDLEHAWLFKTTYGTTGQPVVEYRLMSCHFDPSLDPPVEVYGQSGTKIRRAR